MGLSSEILENIDDVSFEELFQLKESINQIIETKSKLLLTNESEQVEKCPHCQSDKIILWGNYKEKKRFRCKDCSRTFIPTTGTVFCNLKNVSKFIYYLTIMFTEGFISTEQIAARVGVSQRTSFEWRQRLSISLKDEPDKFGGITEMDDVWFRYSQKGRKGLKYSRKRGRSSHKGDGDFSAKVLIAKEREGVTDMSLLKIGRLSNSDIKRKFHDKFEETSILVSDKHPSISSFANSEGIRHESFLAKDHVKDGIYHVQSVNYIAGALDDGINHCLKGVSTKYLQNYVTWLEVKEEYKQKDKKVEKIIKRSINNRLGWDMYTNIECLYKKFILEHSKRTYRCPTKQNWKSQNWNYSKAESGIYI